MNIGKRLQRNKLLYHYDNIVKKEMILTRPQSSPLSLPGLDFCVVHLSSKDVIKNKKNLIYVLFLLEVLTMQLPVPLLAKKSIAAYSLRKGSYMGSKVTLRKGALFEFLDKTFTLAYPRKMHKKYVQSSLICGKAAPMSIDNTFVYPEIEIFSSKFYNFFGIDITLLSKNVGPASSRAFLSSLSYPLIK